MSDQRNLILAIILSVAILVGFQYFYGKPELGPGHEAALHQQTQGQAGHGATSATTAPATSPAAMATPAEAGGTAPGALTTPPVQPTAAAVAAVPAPRIAILSQLLHGSLSLRGDRFDDLSLSDYHKTVDPKSPDIVLLQPPGTAAPYFAEYGWTVKPGSPVALPGPDTLWQTTDTELTPTHPVTLTYDNGQGLHFIRTISLDSHYMFEVVQKVENKGSTPVTLYPYGLITREGDPPTSPYYLLHEGPVGVLDGTLKEHAYKDLVKEGRISLSTTGGWFGFTDKYWLAALIPGQNTTFTATYQHRLGGPLKNIYQADYLGSAVTIQPGASASTTDRLFAGAKEVTLLDQYEKQDGIKRFDLAIDWGWFYFLTKPIFFALDYFYRLLGNFGLAIMLFTVLLKAAFFPLANKSYASMSKMKKLQPEMKKLKERFGDDKTALNQEMMALYKTQKVNPASGCLPMLLQVPVFFALYKVLYITIEMRHAPFFGWIKDLSAPDPTTILNLFGLIHWTPPPSTPHFLMLGAWPIAMGISMFLQQRLNPQPVDPAQAKIFLLMPIFFTFLLGNFPCGLVIYYTWNNLLTMAQQWMIMRRMGVKP